MQRPLLLFLLLLGIVVCYIKSTRADVAKNKFEKNVMKELEAERSLEKSNARTLVLPLQAFNKTMTY